ncbi:hypothetical protein [Rhodopila globiformis]|uniref:hypothetical protein n=1 Tax=Rhodopila globiformis TaxID=1071 RepID=UPI0011B0D298|nr:hypothetical protein [Rhodopila globiformis]
MSLGKKPTILVGLVRETVLAHRHQAAAVIAENALHVAASTDLILESRALLARVDRLLDQHSISDAAYPAAF